MSEPKWHVGQQVVIVEHYRREVGITDATITKVGRKWLTVKSVNWSEGRYDLNGRSERTWGSPPRLWPDRETYEAHAARIAAWREFASTVRNHHLPPTHLTIEQITAWLAALSDPAQQAKGESHDQ